MAIACIWAKVPGFFGWKLINVAREHAAYFIDSAQSGNDSLKGDYLSFRVIIVPVRLAPSGLRIVNGIFFFFSPPPPTPRAIR